MTHQQFREQVERCLHENILSFWSQKMVDNLNGGFYGRMSGDLKLMEDAPKGAILNARILWSFSAAYLRSGKEEYLEMATRAKEYLLKHFIDREFGGVYWSLTAQGELLESKKQIYALGFAIYGLSEYSRATGCKESLREAIELYRTIEKYSFDRERNGYFEAFTRDWCEIGDMRLSLKDANECKTMNTHLHILEPYTNLYRVWRSDELKSSLRNLVELFIDRIYDHKRHHLGLFFNEEWVSRDYGFSYGHDIEASWLLLEAALELKDQELIARVKHYSLLIAEAACEGVEADGSMLYERHADSSVNSDRHWWVQAESVVGLLWLYRHHNIEEAYPKAVAAWEFIRDRLVDWSEGEWWWSVDRNYQKNESDDRAGFWKCPYHNTRMCLEVMELLKE